MSCEAHRGKALQSIAAQSGGDAAQLERVFQAGKSGSAILGYPNVLLGRNPSGVGNRRFMRVDAPVEIHPELKAQFLARGFEFRQGLTDPSRGDWMAPFNQRRKQFALDAFRGAALPPMSKAEEKKYRELINKAKARERNKTAQAFKTVGELDVLARETQEDDLLSSESLADIYSRMATGLVGAPRRVILEVPQNGSSGFATDMRGTIWAHPYPLGKTALARDNMVVTRAGLEHELGHELYTPMDVWQRVLDVAEKKESESGLGEKGAAMLPNCFNVVEDGRMEREVALHNAGSAVVMASSCRLQPRWSGPGGGGDDQSVASDVTGALLYTALPYFDVTPEQQSKMSPRARAIYGDLKPVFEGAVRGTPAEAYHAAVTMAKRFEKEGLLDVPQTGSPPPRPPSGTPKWKPGGQSQSGQSGKTSNKSSPQSSASQTGKSGSSSGQSQQSGKSGSSSGQSQSSKSGSSSGQSQQSGKSGTKSGRSKGRSDQQHCPDCGSFLDENGQCQNGSCPSKTGGAQQSAPPQPRKAAQDNAQPSSPQSDSDTGDDENEADGDASDGDNDQASAGDAESDVPQFLPEELENAARRFEAEAAVGVRDAIKRRATYEMLGKPLHEPLTGSSKEVERIARGLDGLPRTVKALQPVVDGRQTRVSFYSPRSDWRDVIKAQRERAADIAQRIAMELGDIRDAVRLRRNRYLDEGRLDRSRLVGAYKGDTTIYYQESPADDDTSLCASLWLDISSSMDKDAKSGKLNLAATALSEAMTQLQMPHEVRAFSDATYEVKTMGESAMQEDRAALLLMDQSGTALSETATLARTSLLGRVERNKLVLCLSDGVLNDLDHSPACAETKAMRESGILTFGVFLSREQPLNDDRRLKLNEIYGAGNWVEIQTIDQFPNKVARRIADLFREML
jgi:hypothetical protein